MKMKKRKKAKVYRLSDLVDMANQLGCRLRFEMLPVEAFRPVAPEKGQPDKPKRGSRS